MRIEECSSTATITEGNIRPNIQNDYEPEEEGDNIVHSELGFRIYHEKKFQSGKARVDGMQNLYELFLQITPCNIVLSISFIHNVVILVACCCFKSRELSNIHESGIDIEARGETHIIAVNMRNLVMCQVQRDLQAGY